ncbi:HutD family protein [Ottowia sp. GY511]|nr:HutD family protein [Ottowia sp. GY511]
MHAFTLDAIAPTPWKNGGGTTREILCWPPGADTSTFDFRVSVASITQAGPFSAFPGVDRTIALLDGDGVWLKGDGVDHHLATPFAPFAFSGDTPLACELLGDVSTDFNVMSRRASGRAAVEVIVQAHPLPPSRMGLLLAVQDDWQVGDGHALRTGQGLWWTTPSAQLALRPTGPNARLIAVRWSASGRQADDRTS